MHIINALYISRLTKYRVHWLTVSIFNVLIYIIEPVFLQFPLLQPAFLSIVSSRH